MEYFKMASIFVITLGSLIALVVKVVRGFDPIQKLDKLKKFAATDIVNYKAEVADSFIQSSLEELCFSKFGVLCNAKRALKLFELHSVGLISRRRLKKCKRFIDFDADNKVVVQIKQVDKIEFWSVASVWIMVAIDWTYRFVTTVNSENFLPIYAIYFASLLGLTIATLIFLPKIKSAQIIAKDIEESYAKLNKVCGESDQTEVAVS